LAANPAPISIANIRALTASATLDQHADLKGAISLLVALVWTERRSPAASNGIPRMDRSF
jgi:hypothetical protein